MSEALVLLEGIFYKGVNGVTVSPTSDVGAILTPLLGKGVHFSLHHFPPNPPEASPGGGSCLWSGHCPCGHNADPAWLFHLEGRGVLERDSDGNYLVGGILLPFEQKMFGHHGRLVLLVEEPISQDKTTEDLLSEAETLIEVLAGLRGVVK